MFAFRNYLIFVQELQHIGQFSVLVSQPSIGENRGKAEQQEQGICVCNSQHVQGIFVCIEKASEPTRYFPICT